MNVSRTAMRRRAVLVLLGLVATSALVGCGPAGPQPSASPVSSSAPPDSPAAASQRASSTGATSAASQAATQATSQASSQAATSPVPRDAFETWDVCRIGGTPVGYVRTRVSRTELPRESHSKQPSDDSRANGTSPQPAPEDSLANETVWRVDIEQSLTLKRDRQVVQQNMTVTSWETLAAGLLQFESRVASGRELTLSRGVVADGQLRITTTSLGKTESTLVPWQRGWGGFYALELRLRDGLKPRQRIEFQSLIPMLNQPGKSKLEGFGFESTRTATGSQQLLKVKKIDQFGSLKIESSLWVDETGQILKSLLPLPPPGLETLRTTRDVALADIGDDVFDLGKVSAIRLAKPLDRPHARSRIVYRARLQDGTLDDVFARGASQQIKRVDDHTAEITVIAIRPDHPEKSGAAETPPKDDDRVANSLIQSDDPAIVALARKVVPDETAPWKTAVALERLVRDHVRPQPTSQALASAAEVARTGEGDCTEHAVLLAALCRARGIPARVAIGLVYAPSVGGFAYHMWNEVWVRDRWVPLDATLAQGGIGAGHLKLATSSLQGADAYAAFLPVYQILGRLELEAIEVEE